MQWWYGFRGYNAEGDSCGVSLVGYPKNLLMYVNYGARALWGNAEESQSPAGCRRQQMPRRTP
uniref:Uncharacterized protein n=1 Tax=Marinobacter nauticus TaxID=2743 RepID=A0A455W812_MARNT|nr:hypothetical protein YBY_32290 [Marinobacter nauticus]